MKKDKEILEEAIYSLFNCTNLQAVPDDIKYQKDSFLTISEEKFVIFIKPEISKGNKGIVLANLKEVSKVSNLPVLLLTKYIPGEIAREYVGEGINYLDIAGNCYIRHNALVVIIEGKKIRRTASAIQPRAFQEAGLRLIFQFLVNPVQTQLPYRELAKLAGISLGSVASIMQELTELKFILKTKQTKKLKNTQDLLNRWIIGYHDLLRPRLFKRRMRFVKPDHYNNWKELNLMQTDGVAYWGGEPGANLLTGYLQPGNYTIYTDRNWQTFKEIDLIPDEKGNVELVDVFWDTESYQGLPPLLVYADLMSSGSDRNLETAKMILENYLPQISK
jgi:hypothetical protein